MTTFVRTETPTFSWSYSRGKCFDCCRRKYYFSYYGGHNGWERPRGDRRRAAWTLKKLTAYELVLGDELHKVAAAIARAIKTGAPLPDRALARRQIRGRMNALFLGSKRRDAFLARPSQVPMAADAYYGRPVPPNYFERLKAKMDACLDVLFSLPLWDEVRAAADVKLVEDLAQFDVDGVPVWVKPDLVFRSAKRGWVVVDFKSGRTIAAVEQVALYAAFAVDALRLQPRHGTIECRSISLVDGREDVLLASAADIDVARARVRESADEMRALLVDPADNVPADELAFEQTDDLEACRRCPFRELCRREEG